MVQMTACELVWHRHLCFDWRPSMPSAVAKKNIDCHLPGKVETRTIRGRYCRQLVNQTSPVLPLGRPQQCPYETVAHFTSIGNLLKAIKNLTSQCLDMSELKIDQQKHLSSHRLIVSSSSHSPILRHPGAALGPCPAVASPPATSAARPVVSGVASGVASRCPRGSVHRRPPSM